MFAEADGMKNARKFIKEKNKKSKIFSKEANRMYEKSISYRGAFFYLKRFS